MLLPTGSSTERVLLERYWQGPTLRGVYVQVWVWICWAQICLRWNRIIYNCRNNKPPANTETGASVCILEPKTSKRPNKEPRGNPLFMWYTADGNWPGGTQNSQSESNSTRTEPTAKARSFNIPKELDPFRNPVSVQLWLLLSGDDPAQRTGAYWDQRAQIRLVLMGVTNSMSEHHQLEAAFTACSPSFSHNLEHFGSRKSILIFIFRLWGSTWLSSRSLTILDVLPLTSCSSSVWLGRWEYSEVNINHRNCFLSRR